MTDARPHVDGELPEFHVVVRHPNKRGPLGPYRLAVAVAFNDPLRAAELRSEQVNLLPAIEDCLHCHGRPLETGDVCSECGNPLWNLDWLLSAD